MSQTKMKTKMKMKMKTKGRRSCPNCGASDTAVLDTRDYEIKYKEQRETIAQHGWWCDACGEVLLEPDDAANLEKAQVTLKARVEGVLPPEDVAKIRHDLGLSQRQAGKDVCRSDLCSCHGPCSDEHGP